MQTLNYTDQVTFDPLLKFAMTQERARKSNIKTFFKCSEQAYENITSKVLSNDYLVIRDPVLNELVVVTTEEAMQLNQKEVMLYRVNTEDGVVWTDSPADNYIKQKEVEKQQVLQEQTRLVQEKIKIFGKERVRTDLEDALLGRKSLVEKVLNSEYLMNESEFKSFLTYCQ